MEIMKDLTEEIGTLIDGYKFYKNEVEKAKKKYEECRKQIIEKCKEYQITDLGTDYGTVKITYPKSFDEKKCIRENKELCEFYITKETVTITNEVFDKKAFEEDNPILYKRYLKEQSPRVTVK